MDEKYILNTMNVVHDSTVMLLLPPMSLVEVIESVVSVCVSVCICGTYVVHHFDGTELRCAPLTCVVHHQPALCHGAQGGPTFLRSRGHF